MVKGRQGRFYRFLFAQRFPITLFLSPFILSPVVLFVSCTLHKISTKINGFQQFSLNVNHITTEIPKASLQNIQQSEDNMYCYILYGTEGLAFNNKIRLHKNAPGNTQKSHRIRNCESKGIIKVSSLNCG
jgi:hypothetical protein